MAPLPYEKSNSSLPVYASGLSSAIHFSDSYGFAILPVGEIDPERQIITPYLKRMDNMLHYTIHVFDIQACHLENGKRMVWGNRVRRIYLE